jgi:hypothetical protein
MNLPAKAKPGEPVKASEWNKMVDWLRSLVIQPSSRVRVTRGPSGTSLAIVTTPPATRSKIVKVFPFKIEDASTQEDGLRVRIYNGRLGGLLPGEMSLGDNPHYYIYLGTGTHHIIGQVSVADNGTFTGASVYDNGSTGLPSANGNTVYLLIGRVVVGNSGGQPTIQSITQEAAGNQGLVVFASADGSLLQPLWVPQAIP